MINDDISQLSVKRKSLESVNRKKLSVLPLSQSKAQTNTRESDSETAFLQETKRMRFIKVGNLFPDLKLFHDSVRHFMKNKEIIEQPTFTDQEISRLKKPLQNVRAQIADDEYINLVFFYLFIYLFYSEAALY